MGAAPELKMTILGRTIEHFGKQMYKRRPAAIAEIVANCWDAGSKTVKISIPEGNAYLEVDAEIEIEDSGDGMNETDINDSYLVIGRNRREEDAARTRPGGRKIMGFKGIGKLAGFGIGEEVEVLTWKDGKCLKFTLDAAQLRTTAGESQIMLIPSEYVTAPNDKSGTRITLKKLKGDSPVDVDKLREFLGRTFTRTVQGEMTIEINGTSVQKVFPTLFKRFPAPEGATEEVILEDGNKIQYWYGIAEKPIHEKTQRGFVIQMSERTAQGAPYYFDIEAKASGQHAAKYIIGEVVADYLDSGKGDNDDVVSTDRQEIDWEQAKTHSLHAWGDKRTREIFRECTDLRGERFFVDLAAKPDIRSRLDDMDKPNRARAEKILKALGKAEPDEEAAESLASALLTAFEYQAFHDFLEELEKLADSEDPKDLPLILEKMGEWKVLEARAIYEVIKGRVGIIDKFMEMVIDEAPETAGKFKLGNMHDLMADMPWLLHPEWETFAEEETISKSIKKFLDEEKVAVDPQRTDFLSLADKDTLLVIEIKAPGYAVSYDEIVRLRGYVNKLRPSWTVSDDSKKVVGVLIYSGQSEAHADEIDDLKSSENYAVYTWADLVQRARGHYEHYRDVLSGSVGGKNFDAKEQEVRAAKRIIADRAYRGAELRKADGLGASDVSHAEEKQ